VQRLQMLQQVNDHIRPQETVTTPVWPKAGAAAKTRPYDASVVRNPRSLEYPKMNQPRHDLAIRARLFGQELRWECGQTLKNLAMPVRQFLRCQKSS